MHSSATITRLRYSTVLRSSNRSNVAVGVHTEITHMIHERLQSVAASRPGVLRNVLLLLMFDLLALELLVTNLEPEGFDLTTGVSILCRRGDYRTFVLRYGRMKIGSNNNINRTISTTY